MAGTSPAMTVLSAQGRCGFGCAPVANYPGQRYAFAGMTNNF
jgi:hypothetical protein